MTLRGRSLRPHGDRAWSLSAGDPEKGLAMIELERRRAVRGAISAVAAILALMLSTAGGEADTSIKTWFTDSAGRRVEVPAEISRVLAAGPPGARPLFNLGPR